MSRSNQTLLELLRGTVPGFYSLGKDETGYLNPVQMGRLYTNTALLVTSMEFIKEQLWLQERQDERLGEVTSWGALIAPLFRLELAPLLFLKEFLMVRGPQEIRKITRDAEVIAGNLLTMIQQRPWADQKEFVIQALRDMSDHFLREEQLQEGGAQNSGHRGPRHYRTFDGLDGIFDFRYRSDEGTEVESSEERLYKGSGVGVQSGYSTILLALHSLDLEPGAKIIDLGSGFGRVGLVFALMRPDIAFTGYEFVARRVEGANQASRSMNLEDSLAFKRQDLSLESFEIPDADVYYLYDPFTESTYRHVLDQLVAVSRRKPSTIVTKGNARDRLDPIALENKWPDPVRLDQGNLCLYRSMPPGI